MAEFHFQSTIPLNFSLWLVVWICICTFSQLLFHCFQESQNHLQPLPLPAGMSWTHVSLHAYHQRPGKRDESWNRSWSSWSDHVSDVDFSRVLDSHRAWKTLGVMKKWVYLLDLIPCLFHVIPKNNCVFIIFHLNALEVYILYVWWTVI